MSDAWKATERRVSGWISEWFTGNEDALVRPPCSGGWPKKRANGDTIPNTDDPDIPQASRNAAVLFCRTWSMDVKRRMVDKNNPFHFEQLLTADKHPFWDWWQDVNEVANRRGTMRMLIVNDPVGMRYSLVLGEKEALYVIHCIETARGVTVPEGRWADYLGPLFVFDRPHGVEKLMLLDLKGFMERVDSRALGGLGNARQEETA